ncbi:hypothetical protein DL95DRAFT_395029 [Leptodontidium sp. 2 PMI_412]|nr:hypothetical protein DL95DRAFT_395029 [Leptodontidium sp. 2 PMI_412]
MSAHRGNNFEIFAKLFSYLCTSSSAFIFWFIMCPVVWFLLFIISTFVSRPTFFDFGNYSSSQLSFLPPQKYRTHQTSLPPYGPSSYPPISHHNASSIPRASMRRFRHFHHLVKPSSSGPIPNSIIGIYGVLRHYISSC